MKNVTIKCHLCGKEIFEDLDAGSQVDMSVHEANNSTCSDCKLFEVKIHSLKMSELLIAVNEAISDECWCTPGYFNPCIRCQWDELKDRIERFPEC